MDGAAFAQETTYFKYDALGRMILADARGSSAQGGTTAYNYDPAANRSSVDRSVVKFSVIIPSGQQIVAGESVGTDSMGYRLTLQSDGDLVLYDRPNSVIWHTGTTTGHSLAMQGDGNLVLYSASGVALWSTGTSGHSGAYFAVQADGNLVVYDSSNSPLWARF